MKTLIQLLNSTADKKIGNYSIRFYAPRCAKLYYYDAEIADINFGDNFGRGACFKITYNGFVSSSVSKCINFLCKYLSENGFKELC